FYEIASDRGRAKLEEKIRQEFISPYFKKYDLEVIFQDYQSLELNSRYAEEYGLLVAENETDYENIYFIDEGTNFKYICKAGFEDFVALVVLQIKKRVPSNVYPALLTDSKYISFPDNFDYAVFAGDDILFHRTKFGQGEWPSIEDFDNENLYDEGIEKNDRHYFGVNTSDGRTILIISKKYSKRDLLANFCFFFLLLLSGFSLYSSINSIQAHGLVLNFTSKIQLYLSLAFIVPLLTTGFALLTSLNTSYREEIDRTYLKQALYISEILSNEMSNEMGEETQSDLLTKIGNYIQSDISFYNESGYLIATSQPDIFSLGLQSNLVNPVVFEELVMKENQSMIAEESIGSLDYKVCYALVNTSENQVAGFIAMPFFDSKNHLRRQQIEIFENLITIFGLIFILAIMLGNFVLNNLLYPLRMVAGKIRQVTLQDVNKPILYESSDEIGSLVRDYNHMLIKLEDSKIALARSQKETAWKEIARQVAHEIKNPLTPMQLKIQQMLRKYESGSKDHDTLTSLLTQVGTLSQIAESFSAFAEMPPPENEVFVWNDLINRIAMLYRSDVVMIELDLEGGVRIDADRDIFRRILNNIVLNAIQSVEEGQAEISINLEKKSGKAVLSVSDNGKGVPDELKDKIFLNYFSTKSTG
ncbi:MAG: ATP-binding protein, partial [Bacteroidota bacterium]